MAKAIRIEDIAFEPTLGTTSGRFHGTLTVAGKHAMQERRVSAPGHASWTAQQIFRALSARLQA